MSDVASGLNELISKVESLAKEVAALCERLKAALNALQAKATRPHPRLCTNVKEAVEMKASNYIIVTCERAGKLRTFKTLKDVFNDPAREAYACRGCAYFKPREATQ